LQITCDDSARILDECNRVFVEQCNGDRDLVLICSDSELTNGHPNFEKSFDPAGQNKFYPTFYYDDKKTYVCDGAIGPVEANFMCQSIGYEKGGRLTQKKSDDMPLSITGGSKYAMKVKCPFDASGFGKDCRVQQVGQPCSDFALIHCTEPRSFQPS